MKVLLVHQNFPGQFRHIAPGLLDRGHEIAVITDRKNTVHSQLLTARYAYDPPDKAKVAEAGAPLAAHHAQMVGRGAAAARVALRLRDERGFYPDVVFAHPGWGETLFLKEIWPKARFLLYAEFYYASRGLDADFDPEFQKSSLGRSLNTIAMRTHIAQAMTEADAALAPTHWQASTFPPCFRDLIEVVFDGVDTVRLKPDPAASYTLPNGTVLKAGEEVLTFVVRNIEPYRGAHIFFRALPEVLRARPNAQVVVVGANGVSYGAPPPGGGSWREVFLKEIAGRLDLSRVHFTGRLPYDDFCRVVQVGRVHAYLTYPFVLSWSMLETMAMGGAIVGSRTPPVQEIIKDGVNGRLVDFFDVEGWSEALIRALSEPDALRPLRAAARQTVLDRYDLKVCLPKILDLVENTKLR